MRKRLRKKLRLAEFEEVLVPIAFELPDSITDQQVDDFIDLFLDEIESQGLGFGGGGNKRWSGLAAPFEKWAKPTSGQAAALRFWLESQELVQRAWVGSPITSSELDTRLRANPDFPTVDDAIS